MRILLLSAYDADSHQYWRKGLVGNLDEHDWTVLTLPGRYFSWRIRGNSMSWAFGPQASILQADYDLVIATSMTDLATLRGFVPSLATIPTIIYFHENQFAYPATANARANVEPLILNLYSALAADKIVFNSQYNYQSFIQGASALLNKLPDQVPTNIIERINSRCAVLPVPLKTAATQSSTSTAWDKYVAQPVTERPLLIAWAARWEYDKGPDNLLAIVSLLVEQKVNFRLCIMGQSFRQIPKEFKQLENNFADFIDQFGYAQSHTEYVSWLKNADMFLSTAVHEFQGLAVLEAVDQHCIPILPNRLVYPELFDREYLYADECGNEAQAAVDLILKQQRNIEKGAAIAPSHQLHWQALKPAYQQLISNTLSGD